MCFVRHILYPSVEALVDFYWATSFDYALNSPADSVRPQSSSSIGLQLDSVTDKELKIRGWLKLSIFKLGLDADK